MRVESSARQDRLSVGQVQSLPACAVYLEQPPVARLGVGEAVGAMLLTGGA